MTELLFQCKMMLSVLLLLSLLLKNDMLSVCLLLLLLLLLEKLYATATFFISIEIYLLLPSIECELSYLSTEH